MGLGDDRHRRRLGDINGDMAIPHLELNVPGVRMPMLALGTGLDHSPGSRRRSNVTAALLTALELGYTHFDTAEIYPSFGLVGRVLRGRERSTYFVTTKVDPTSTKARRKRCADAGPECTLATSQIVNQSLARLGIGHVDLLLLHRPPEVTSSGGDAASRAAAQCSQVQAQWRALERAFHANAARAIGISNYCVRTLQCLLATATVRPAALQQQHRIGMGSDPYGMISWAARLGIAYVAYSALGGADRSTSALLSQRLVREAAAAHGVSEAEVAIKWVVQQRIPLIVLSSSKEHLANNLQMYDHSGDGSWVLSEGEMAGLSALTTPAGRPSQWGACEDSAAPAAGSSSQAVLPPPGGVPAASGAGSVGGGSGQAAPPAPGSLIDAIDEGLRVHCRDGTEPSPTCVEVSRFRAALLDRRRE